MASPLGTTIFAQRMALRERLLNQSREDKMIEDDRKVKLIAETNRSTDLALQAQAKAMERKRRDAAALADSAAYQGEDAPQFDEEGPIQDAVAVGTASGSKSSLMGMEKRQLDRELEMSRQRGATGRAMMTDKRGRDIAGAANEDRDAARAQRGTQFEVQQGLRQAKNQREESIFPLKMESERQLGPMRSRMPAQFGMQPQIQADKDYRDMVARVHSERSVITGEIAKLSQGLVGPILNDPKLIPLRERLTANLHAEGMALQAKLSVSTGDPELTKRLSEINAALMQIQSGVMPNIPAPQPTVGQSEPSGSNMSAPDEAASSGMSEEDQILNELGKGPR